MEQRSQEWYQARLGKATASRISDVVARLKTGGWGVSRKNYRAELVSERLTGLPYENYVSKEMIRGMEIEPQARAAYMLETGSEVVEVGFIPHPTIPMSGASPDGFVDDDGLVEFKCPNTATHLETLHDEPVGGDYVKQIMWQLACTGRAWCDFASYDPRLPGRASLKIIRVYRNDEKIAYLELEVPIFLREVETEVEFVRSLERQEAA